MKAFDILKVRAEIVNAADRKREKRSGRRE